MTSISSKSIPFIVLLLAGGMITIDTFTDYTVNETMISFAEIILVPLGLGGLANKGWNVYRDVKKREMQSIQTKQGSGTH